MRRKRQKQTPKPTTTGLCDDSIASETPLVHHEDTPLIKDQVSCEMSDEVIEESVVPSDDAGSVVNESNWENSKKGISLADANLLKETAQDEVMDFHESVEQQQKHQALTEECREETPTLNIDNDIESLPINTQLETHQVAIHGVEGHMERYAKGKDIETCMAKGDTETTVDPIRDLATEGTIMNEQSIENASSADYCQIRKVTPIQETADEEAQREEEEKRTQASEETQREETRTNEEAQREGESRREELARSEETRREKEATHSQETRRDELPLEETRRDELPLEETQGEKEATHSEETRRDELTWNEETQRGKEATRREDEGTKYVSDVSSEDPFAVLVEPAAPSQPGGLASGLIGRFLVRGSSPAGVVETETASVSVIEQQSTSILSAATSTFLNSVPKVPVKTAIQTGGFLRQKLIDWFDEDDEEETQETPSKPSEETSMIREEKRNVVPLKTIETLLQESKPVKTAASNDQNHINVMEEQLKTKLETIARLHEQVNQLRDANRRHIVDTEKVKSALADARELIAVKDKAIASLNEQIRSITDDIAEETRDRYQKELDDLLQEKDIQLNEIQNALKQKSKQCELLSRQLDDLNGETAQVVATARKEERQLRVEVERLTDEAKMEKESLREAQQKLTEISEAFTRERQSLHLTIKSLTAKENAAKVRETEQMEEIRRLQTEVDGIKQMNAKLKMTATGLETLQRLILESGLIKEDGEDENLTSIRSNDYGSWIRAIRGVLESYKARLKDAEAVMESQSNQITSLASELDRLNRKPIEGGSLVVVDNVSSNEETGSSNGTVVMRFNNVSDSVNGAAAARVASLQLRLAAQQERDEGLTVQNEILKGRISNLQLELQQLRESIGIQRVADTQISDKKTVSPPVLYYEKSSSLLKGKIEKFLAPIIGRSVARKIERYLRAIWRLITRSKFYAVLTWQLQSADARIRYLAFLMMRYFQIRLLFIVYLTIMHIIWFRSLSSPS